MRGPEKIDFRQLQEHLEDPDYVEQLRVDPKKALGRVSSRTPLDTDVWIYRIVVICLGMAVLLAVGGAIFLAARVTDGTVAPIPEILVAIGSAAVGALAGLLAPAPSSPSAN